MSPELRALIAVLTSPGVNPDDADHIRIVLADLAAHMTALGHDGLADRADRMARALRDALSEREAD
jgi:hypothetical protein